jgi:adenylate cyclase
VAADREPPPKGKIRVRARGIDSRPGLVEAIKQTRELLPGDEALGATPASEPERPTDLLVRYLSEVGDRPSAFREIGLGVVQLSRALADTRERQKGTVRLAIMFTDLVEFSAWALRAGDANALALLRAVGQHVEPTIRSHRGRLVKRLGDGHMAVFRGAADAVEAADEAHGLLREVEVEGYHPSLRVGIHVGYPRKVRSDYLGVDVNVAARVAAAASGGEILVSGPALEELDPEAFSSRRRKRFQAKGAPSDLEVYTVRARR